MSEESLELVPPEPDADLRLFWLTPTVSRLNACSAQSGPGDSIPDAGDFS
jgi:hypothetical protein